MQREKIDRNFAAVGGAKKNRGQRENYMQESLWGASVENEAFHQILDRTNSISGYTQRIRKINQSGIEIFVSYAYELFFFQIYVNRFLRWWKVRTPVDDNLWISIFSPVVFMRDEERSQREFQRGV